MFSARLADTDGTPFSFLLSASFTKHYSWRDVLLREVMVVGSCLWVVKIFMDGGRCPCVWTLKLGWGRILVFGAGWG